MELMLNLPRRLTCAAPWRLFHRNAFCEIARLVGILAHDDGSMIGEQLDRHRIDHRREFWRDILHDNGGGGLARKIAGELAAANQNQPAAAGRDFLHIRDRFFKHPSLEQ